MGQKKQQGQQTTPTICKERLTLLHGCHTWHDPVADVGVERGETRKGCCVWEKEEERVRCEMDQIKQQGPQLSTFGKERLTIAQGRHTWHDPLADVGVERGSTIKGCCVWEEKEESVRCEMDRIKQQRTTTINNWQGKTYCIAGLSHLTRPSCWCRR